MNVFRGASIYALGNLFSKAVYFAVLPLVVRKIGASQYGVFSSIETLYSLFPALMSFSIEVGIYRLYHDYKDSNSKARYLGTIYTSVVILATMITTLLLLVPGATHWLFPKIPFRPYFVLAIWISFMNALLSIPKAVLQVQERAISFTVLTLAQVAFTISLVLIFVLWGNWASIGYLRAVLIASACMVPLSFLMIKRSVIICWDKGDLFRSILFSLPILPGLIFSWILNASDRAILGRHLSESLIGVYSLGWKYSTLSVLAISSINTAFAPVFYRLINSGVSEAATKIADLLETAMIVMVFVVYVNSVVGVDAIRYFSSPEFSQAKLVIVLICLSTVPSIYGLIANLQLYQMKKSYIAMLFVVSAGAISITANTLLIPHLGIFAPPISLMIVNVYLWIPPYFVAQKICYIPVRWKRVVLFSAILIAIRFATFTFLTERTGQFICYLLTLAISIYGWYNFKKWGNAFV